MEKVIKILKVQDTNTDYIFWSNKSPKERLEAIEFLRQQYIQFTNASQRFQKVCLIIRKSEYRHNK